MIEIQLAWSWYDKTLRILQPNDDSFVESSGQDLLRDTLSSQRITYLQPFSVKHQFKKKLLLNEVSHKKEGCYCMPSITEYKISDL